MQSRYRYLSRLVLFTSDIVLINTAFMISYYFAIDGGMNIFSDTLYRNFLLITNLIWFFASSITGMYRSQSLDDLIAIYRATWRSVGLHGVIFIAYLVFSKNQDISRSFLISLYSFFSVLFLMSRFCGTVMEFVISRKYKIGRSVAVLGKNSTALRLAGILEKSQSYKFEGFLEDEETIFVGDNGELVPAACKEIARAATLGVQEVYVSMTPDKMSAAKYLLDEAEKQCVRLKFVPDLSGSLAAPFSVSYLGDFPVISLRNEPLENVENRFKKRLFDILFSSMVIVFVLSWLVPLIAILIKIESPGPVFFKQLRSGRNNLPFWCFKFRSMHVNNDSDKVQARKGDSRITKIGAFLRKTSLDEFPQFFNVLFGDMSIVGPRPHMLKHTEQYSAIIDRYMVRQFLKPGITGWAQVNGFRGETRDQSLMEKRVEHDIWYMENWSSMLDVKIIFMTVINIFKGEENAG